MTSTDNGNGSLEDWSAIQVGTTSLAATEPEYELTHTIVVPSHWLDSRSIFEQDFFTISEFVVSQHEQSTVEPKPSLEDFKLESLFIAYAQSIAALKEYPTEIYDVAGKIESESTPFNDIYQTEYDSVVRDAPNIETRMKKLLAEKQRTGAFPTVADRLTGRVIRAMVLSRHDGWDKP